MSENETIIQNLGLVKRILRKFKPRNRDEYDEMLQIGRIALLYAIRRHDPTRGKLSTLAWYTITQAFIKYKKNNQYVVTISDLDKIVDEESYEYNDFDYQSLSERQKQILKLKAKGYNFKEIAEHLELKTYKVMAIYHAAIELIRAENE